MAAWKRASGDGRGGGRWQLGWGQLRVEEVVAGGEEVVGKEGGEAGS